MTRIFEFPGVPKASFCRFPSVRLLAILLAVLSAAPVRAMTDSSDILRQGSDAIEGGNKLGVAPATGEGPGPVSPEARKLNRQAERAEDDERYEEAAAKYSQACDLLYPRSCANAARIYAVHSTSAGSQQRARGLYEQGCAQNNIAACKEAASMQMSGVGGPVDRDGAASLYAVVCDQDDRESCALRGLLLNQKALSSASKAEYDALLPDIRHSFVRACDLGDLKLCVDAGSFLIEGLGGPIELPRAIEYSLRACDGNEMKACANLGVLVRDGVGMPADQPAARGYFEQACDGGVPSACNNLGNWWSDKGTDGPSLSDDHKRAHVAFRLACEAGDAMGCANLGNQYYFGEGTPKDFSAAVPVLSKACEMGNGRGCYVLAVMNLNGEAMPINRVKWWSLARTACDFGFMQGCNAAGYQFRDGADGADKDLDLAADYFSEACKGGFQLGCENLTNLRNRQAAESGRTP